MKNSSTALAACLVFAALAICPAPSHAQTVWTGPQTSFTKADFADPFDPANQDSLVTSVSITRADTMGIFNPKSEIAFDGLVSPAGTEWAFLHNNPGATVAASNHAALDFAVWRDAHGNSPGTTVGQPAVVHLIADDIYLDISFTSYSGGGPGGGFSYVRSTPQTVPALGLAGRLLMGLGVISLGVGGSGGSNWPVGGRERVSPRAASAIRRPTPGAPTGRRHR